MALDKINSNTLAPQVVAQLQPGRNLLDNSNFQIHQRGTGPHDLRFAGDHGADRWASFQSSTTHAIPSASGYEYLTMSRSTSSATILGAQAIRLDDRAKAPYVAGNTFTLSWDQHSAVEHSAGARVSFQEDWVYPSGEVIHEAPAIMTIPAATWTRVSTTFTIGTDASAAMDRITVECGSFGGASITAGEPVRLRNVKLELGAVETAYEPTPYGVDETECMKWFYSPKNTVYAFPALNGTTTLARYAQVNFPVPMYFIPHTFTETLGTGYAGGVTKNVIGTSGYQIRGLANAANNGTFISDITASCEL